MLLPLIPAVTELLDSPPAAEARCAGEVTRQVAESARLPVETEVCGRG